MSGDQLDEVVPCEEQQAGVFLQTLEKVFGHFKRTKLAFNALKFSKEPPWIRSIVFWQKHSFDWQVIGEQGKGVMRGNKVRADDDDGDDDDGGGGGDDDGGGGDDDHNHNVLSPG